MFNKYNLPGEARLLLLFAGANVQSIVNWFGNNLRPNDEILKVEEWTQDCWYFVIQDKNGRAKGLQHPREMMFGLTVDLKNDRVFWSNDFKRGFGGNCFCRSERWMRLLFKQFPDCRTDRGMVRDYRFSSGSRERKTPAA